MRRARAGLAIQRARIDGTRFQVLRAGNFEIQATRPYADREPAVLPRSGQIRIAPGGFERGDDFPGLIRRCAPGTDFDRETYAKPPLARKTWELTQPPSGQARNETTLAISSGYRAFSAGQACPIARSAPLSFP
jgi:hypothetical protein